MSKNIGKKNGKYKHGLSYSRIYRTWGNMLYRCNNANCPNYKNYGGKGIIVCNEWYEFSNFYLWAINNGYSDELTIDRIDSSKNYEPNNCQWITKTENTIKANKKKQHRKADKGMYYAISPNGEYYEFENANEFSREHNLNANGVRRVANKKEGRTHYKHWKFGFLCEIQS